jgi:hypothetical protein
MWKLLAGFVAFAAVVMVVLTQADADVDMSGEKHGADATHVPDSADKK